MSDSISTVNTKKWSIVETLRGNNETEVSVVPVNWINVDSGLLFWPRDMSKKALNTKLEFCAEPAKNWKKYKISEILEDGKEFRKFHKTLKKKRLISKK